MSERESTRQPVWKREIARRTFLKWTAATGGAAALGGSLLNYKANAVQAAGPDAAQATSSGLPYGADKIVPVKCGCGDVCGAYHMGQAYVKDGKIVYYDGCDAAENEGSLCLRGMSAMQIFNHPDRCKYPMKRLNAKGEVGKFERISWDEAYDLIADQMVAAINDGEPYRVGVSGTHAMTRTLSVAQSRFRDMFRFASAGGSGGCWNDLQIAGGITLGDYYHAHVEDFHYSKLIILWGHNKAISMPSEWSHGIMKAKEEHGTKLIVVDPRFSETAEKADLYLPIRPGTDAALALGMANVIITEGLTDDDFIAKYTTGYDAFRQQVMEYTPEKVEEITWCPADRIRQAARWYATMKPAMLEFGRGGNYSGGEALSGIMCARAATCLIGLCGQAAVRGAGFSVENSSTSPSGTGFSSALSGGLNWQGDPLVPEADAPKADSKKVFTYREPYGLRVLYTYSSYSSSFGDQDAVEDSLLKTPFTVVENRFINYTASKFADVVLPNATWVEQAMIYAEYTNIVCTEPAIEPMFESKPTYLILGELAERICQKLGLDLTPEEVWPYRTSESVINGMLKGIPWLANPTFKYDVEGYPNLDYKELIKHPEGIRMPRYHNQDGFVPYKAKWYVEDPADPEAPYFPTQGGTGKLEFDSPWLAEKGLPTLPVHDEPVESPYRTPEVWKEYPFIAHTRVHTHWSFLQYNLVSDGGFGSDLVREADRTAAEPCVQLNPDAASKLGLSEGDMVWVESQHGKLQAKLLLSRRLPEWMVAVTYSWSSIMNRLNPFSVSPTVSGLKQVGPYGKGTWKGGGQNIMCGILCKVYKA